MDNPKYLGKIVEATFGPHPDLGMGLWLEFAFNGRGTTWFEGITNVSKLADLSQWCRQAKVADVSKLVGKPVEIELRDGVLNKWRILTEVL